jgi:hypothetical protein
MRDNGSGDPLFDFDEGRTWFRVTLPAHPEYVAVSALRDALLYDARGIHEFAQTKMQLARQNRHDSHASRRLLREAKALLERVLRMEGDSARHAWAWRDLARTSKWLGYPSAEIRLAYENAMKLLPGEPRFRQEFQAWQKQREKRDGRSAMWRSIRGSFAFTAGAVEV